MNLFDLAKDETVIEFENENDKGEFLRWYIQEGGSDECDRHKLSSLDSYVRLWIYNNPYRGRDLLYQSGEYIHSSITWSEIKNIKYDNHEAQINTDKRKYNKIRKMSKNDKIKILEEILNISEVKEIDGYADYGFIIDNYLDSLDIEFKPYYGFEEELTCDHTEYLEDDYDNEPCRYDNDYSKCNICCEVRVKPAKYKRPQ